MLEALYYSFLLTLSIIVALCIIDERLAYFIWIQFQICRITVAKWILMARIYPKSWLSHYFMKRRIAKLTKELQQELIKQQQEPEK